MLTKLRMSHITDSLKLSPDLAKTVEMFLRLVHLIINILCTWMVKQSDEVLHNL